MKKWPQGDSRGAITRKACSWRICCSTLGGCSSELFLLTGRGRWLTQPAPASAGPFFLLKEHFSSHCCQCMIIGNHLIWGVPDFEGYLALEFMFEDIVRLLRTWMIILKALYPLLLHSRCSRSKGGVGGWDISRRCSVLPAYQHLSPLERMYYVQVHQTLVWPRALLEAEWVEIRFERGDIQRFPVVLHKAAVSFCLCPFLDRLYQTLLPSDWWSGGVAEQNFKVHHQVHSRWWT